MRQYYYDHSWQSSLASGATACIDLKICILVYKCLHQLVAPYLASMISPVSAVSTRRRLRSVHNRWSVGVEQSAAGYQDDIADTRTVLWPAEN